MQRLISHNNDNNNNESSAHRLIATTTTTANYSSKKRRLSPSSSAETIPPQIQPHPSSYNLFFSPTTSLLSSPPNPTLHRSNSFSTTLQNVASGTWSAAFLDRFSGSFSSPKAITTPTASPSSLPPLMPTPSPPVPNLSSLPNVPSETSTETDLTEAQSSIVARRKEQTRLRWKKIAERLTEIVKEQWITRNQGVTETMPEGNVRAASDGKSFRVDYKCHCGRHYMVVVSSDQRD